MTSKNEIFISYLNSLVQTVNIKNYFYSFYNYYKTYKNYYEVINSRISNKFPIKAELKNGKIVILDNAITAYYCTVYYLKLKDLEINDDYMKFTYMNRVVKFYGWKYGDPAAPFALHEYKFLDVNGKTIVDIGASIGDTPVYFALNEAKKVIGFEPFPKIFLIAKKNIEENGLRDKIILVNAGCGYDGKVKINPELDTNAGTLLKDQRDGIEVPVYSLNTIVENFDVEEDSILKVDCEGCEYDLLRTADINVMRRFSKIMIEYHYGYKELIKRLKNSGFGTRHTIPKHMKNGMILGYVYAWRE